EHEFPQIVHVPFKETVFVLQGHFLSQEHVLPDGGQVNGGGIQFVLVKEGVPVHLVVFDVPPKDHAYIIQIPVGIVQDGHQGIGLVGQLCGLSLEFGGGIARDILPQGGKGDEQGG